MPEYGKDRTTVIEGDTVETPSSDSAVAKSYELSRMGVYGTVAVQEGEVLKPHPAVVPATLSAFAEDPTVTPVLITGQLLQTSPVHITEVRDQKKVAHNLGEHTALRELRKVA
ncbi:hypothetical protein HY024_01420 [Candidatus Curtissbacteria bacterium]|nr:hypothetical protein [Candidatus Curtissbacteria bacterium]